MSPTCQNMWETKPDNSNPEEIICNSLWLKECLMFVSSVPPPPQDDGGPWTAKRWPCFTKTSWTKTEYDMQIITSELFCSWVSPTAPLGASPPGAVGLNWRCHVLQQTNIARAFCELALKSGWKSGSDIFCPHTSPLWLLYVFWAGFKL